MTLSENPPQEAELLDLKRQAFLLNQFDTAPDGKLSQGDANKFIPTQIKKELNLSAPPANKARKALAARGLLTEQKVKKSVIYTITEAGRTWLEAHREHLPTPPPKPAPRKKREPKPKPEPKTGVQVPIHVSREAFLLLHLLDGPEEGRTVSDLCKQAGSKQLKLDDKTMAGQVLSELSERQLVLVTHVPRSDKYTLTPTGQLHLFTLSVDDSVKVTLTGSGLTKLLQVAHSGRSTAPAAEPVSKPTAPTTSQLEAAVMEIFVELRRERYANTKLVPIHEVRAILGRQFGDEVASHEVFDELVLGMRRSKKVALLSISDRSRATEAQLRDSIVAVGETFYYLENVNDSSSG